MTDGSGKGKGSGLGAGRLIAIIVISIASAALIFGNLETTSVWLWGITVNLPLFVVLIIVFILGMLLGGVVRSTFRKLRGADRS